MSCNNHHGCCCQGKSSENQNKHNCCNEGRKSYQKEILLTEQEAEFLMQLAQTPFLPLARFVLKSSKSSHLESVALAPVYLNNKTDSMESVKNTADVLKSLAGKGLITLDYEVPLQNGNYTAYSDSLLYAYFIETVSEGSNRDGFLFDIAALELGSIALTQLGQNAIIDLGKLQHLIGNHLI